MTAQRIVKKDVCRILVRTAMNASWVRGEIPVLKTVHATVLEVVDNTLVQTVVHVRMENGGMLALMTVHMIVREVVNSTQLIHAMNASQGNGVEMHAQGIVLGLAWGTVTDTQEDVLCALKMPQIAKAMAILSTVKYVYQDSMG